MGGGVVLAAAVVAAIDPTRGWRGRWRDLRSLSTVSPGVRVSGSAHGVMRGSDERELTLFASTWSSSAFDFCRSLGLLSRSCVNPHGFVDAR